MRRYNPLSIAELGKNAVRALMAYDIAALPPDPEFDGGGVYVLHYNGKFSAYDGLGDRPIYVGKANPDLYGRLCDHAQSITAANNLELDGFGCRWLILDPVWINLTEQILIERYGPIWNRVLTGFGNHDPGGGRRNQKRSLWDTVHPGRPWADSLKDAVPTATDLVHRIKTHRENSP